jgi:PiT family inorganic phosphate transporter
MTALLNAPLLISLIIVALTFDFLNGLHDTANSIATVAATRMLQPRYAVVWAAFFNFVAFLVFGVQVLGMSASALCLLTLLTQE